VFFDAEDRLASGGSQSPRGGLSPAGSTSLSTRGTIGTLLALAQTCRAAWDAGLLRLPLGAATRVKAAQTCRARDMLVCSLSDVVQGR
jgi:hypothetical protein